MSASPGDDVSPTQLDTPASLVPEVAHVYDLFSALCALAKERFHRELGGKLLLYGRLDAEGAAVALAANIAGAATLGVDGDGERLRQGIRHGFCDFLVNNLDEALRILKNEVRKKQPVSVCLEGDVVATLREAVERGLQPDILAFEDVEDVALQVLIDRGAIVLDQGFGSDASLTGVIWEAQTAPAMWLPKVDALAAEVLPAGDERLRWLKLAPRYLGRSMAGRRYLRMTSTEEDRFSTLVAAAAASGAVGTKITIQRQDPILLERRR